ncbi:hypothetical protein [Brevundimonas sp.]|uniref:hypothetical protein n=1 Tax=Brevundimonas sp. TaxID=1871086 RepID=UPI0035B100B5
MTVPGIDNPLMYSKGADEAGRNLALRLAERGEDIQLEIRLQGGALAAKFMVLAADQPAAVRL